MVRSPDAMASCWPLGLYVADRLGRYVSTASSPVTTHLPSKVEATAPASFT